MKPKMIPSIHNYCDRWCERCVFIDRCAVGIEELERWKRETPLTEEELWDAVSEHFKESLRMLDNMLEEAGIDPAEMEAQEPLEPNLDQDKLEEEMEPIELCELVFFFDFFDEGPGNLKIVASKIALWALAISSSVGLVE